MDIAGMTEVTGENKYLHMLSKNSGDFTNEVQKAEAKINNIMLTVNNAEGDADKQKGETLRKLSEATDKYNTLFRMIIKEFCEDYKLTLPSDGKDHSADIANALHIVEMLGVNIDIDNLDNILSPLSKDFKSLKTVGEVILAKSRNSFNNAYSVDVIEAVTKRLGLDTGIHEFNARMDFLKGIWETPTQYYRYMMNGNVKVKLTTMPSYTALAAPDWIKETAEMYNKIKQSDFYKSMI